LSVLSLCALVSACSPTALEPIVMPDHKLISCDDYAYQLTPFGLLTNNVWNKHVADKAKVAASQCILSQQRAGSTIYGWSWSWPTSPRTVFAQPQIKIGASPWDPSPSFGSQLPIAIKQIESAKFTHKLDVIYNGNFNIVSTMWLVDQPLDIERFEKNEEQERLAQKEAIRTELMIWTYYTPNQFKPGGKHLATITVDNVAWEYWYEPKWGDVSGINDHSWRYIAFRRATPSLDAEINIEAMLQYALEQGHIDANWFIADLELGTEVMGGDGFATVEEFGFTLKEK